MTINVVMLSREPFVVKQDPNVNSSQKSPLIDQQCCCECGDSLDGIFCQQCTCKSYGKGAHIGYNCPPKNSRLSLESGPTKQTVNGEKNPTKLEKEILNSQNEFFNSQNEQFNSGCEHLKTQMTTLHDLIAQAMQKKEEEKRIAEEQAAKERYWKIPICDDDDIQNDYTIAIPPVLINRRSPQTRSLWK
ncbi:hypothetical protein Tco_1105832 [Tanacetum coccineum]